MKKYILVLSLLGLMVFPGFSLAQVAGDVDPNASTSDCVSITNNLRYRDRDASKNGEVSTLQDFLQAKGYLNSEPTGYLGLLTLQAVKDYQRSKNINPTGYVGPVTRATIAADCGSTATTVSPTITPSSPTTPTTTSTPIADVSGSYITVLSPNGGEVWKVGETHRITWASSRINRVRIYIYTDGANLGSGSTNYISETISNRRYYDWTIDGKSLPPFDSSFPRTYKIRVDSMDDPNNVTVRDSSDNYFTITSSDVGDGCLVGQNYSSTTGKACDGPVISGVSGPQTLDVNQTGTWTVNASNKNGGILYYSVDWEDAGVICPSGVSCGASQTYQQSATFYHSYSQTGIYYPKFKVSNSSGQSDETSISVKVGGAVSTNTPPSIVSMTLKSPAGDVPTPLVVTVGQSLSFQFYATDLDGDDLHWSIGWEGVGGVESEVCNTNPQQRRGWTYNTEHAWNTVGETSVKVWVSDCRGGTDTKFFNVSVRASSTVPSVDLKVDGMDGPVTKTAPATITLSWTSNNVQVSSCSASGGYGNWVGAKPASGSETIVGIPVSSTYTPYNFGISCYSNTGYYSKPVGDSVQVNVVAPAPVPTNAQPSLGAITIPVNIIAGQSASFNFNATDQDNDNLYWSVVWGGSGGGGEGSMTCPTSNSQQKQNWTYNTSHTWDTAGTYSVSVTVSDCKGGTAANSFNVSVGSSISSAPIVTISASPSSITSGSSAMISWSVTGNPSTCVLSGTGGVAASGSKVVYPSSTTTYSLSCTGAGGTGSGQTTVSVTTSASTPAPTGLTATAVSQSQINLSWNLVSNTGGYYIYRGGVQVGSTGAGVASYSDTGLAAGTTYSYYVTAYGNSGVSGPSNTVSATTSASISTPPTTAVLTVSAAPNAQDPATQIKVSWNAVGDYYNVDRSLDNQSWTFIGQTGATYIYDVGLASGSVYYYRVQAVKTDGTKSAYGYASAVTRSASASSAPALSANALDALNSASSSVSSSCVFTMNLSKGMNNPEVKCLQKLLNEKGFKVEGVEPGNETTYFGYSTLMALKAFQASNNLAADGIFGPSSQALLQN